MHGIIGDLLATDKTTRPVIRFDCYIDTIGIFFPMMAMPKADWTSLCSLYGGKPHKYRNRKKRYMLVFFQCPQPALLRELERLCREYCGNIYRLDIGCDARIDPFMTTEEQFVFLKEHMLLIKRSAQRILEINNQNGTIGCYWVPHAHVQGAPRDICLYWDKYSKLDPYNIVAHIDFRLRGDWISGLTDLEHLDPSEQILRHIRFVEFDRVKCLRALFRKVMKEAGSIDEARRIIAHMKRHGQLDFVQRIYDEHRITLHTNNDLVRLPHTLTWGAKRRVIVEKTMRNEINDLHMGDCIWGAHEHGHALAEPFRPGRRLWIRPLGAKLAKQTASDNPLRAEGEGEMTYPFPGRFGASRLRDGGVEGAPISFQSADGNLR